MKGNGDKPCCSRQRAKRKRKTRQHVGRQPDAAHDELAKARRVAQGGGDLERGAVPPDIEGLVLVADEAHFAQVRRLVSRRTIFIASGLGGLMFISPTRRLRVVR